MKTIVITGASSGIGKASAAYFAAQGWAVAATMRRPERETELNAVDGVSLYALDVTDERSIASAVRAILGDHETVDVVLNNAGYGLAGPFEAASVEEVKRQFDTNLFGLMSVTRAFLPHFRERRSGLFLNVSSIGGRVTFPFISLYHSTKWAVEGFSESLSYELSVLGIRVKIIEPGGVKTDFGGRSLAVASREGLTDYDDSFAAFQKNSTAMAEGGSSAEYAAEAIFSAAVDESDRLRYLVGADAEAIYEQRTTHGDDAFIAAIKAQTLS